MQLSTRELGKASAKWYILCLSAKAWRQYSPSDNASGIWTGPFYLAALMNPALPAAYVRFERGRMGTPSFVSMASTNGRSRAPDPGGGTWSKEATAAARRLTRDQISTAPELPYERIIVYRNPDAGAQSCLRDVKPVEKPLP